MFCYDITREETRSLKTTDSCDWSERCYSFLSVSSLSKGSLGHLQTENQNDFPLPNSPLNFIFDKIRPLGAALATPEACVLDPSGFRFYFDFLNFLPPPLVNELVRPLYDRTTLFLQILKKITTPNNNFQIFNLSSYRGRHAFPPYST